MKRLISSFLFASLLMFGATAEASRVFTANTSNYLAPANNAAYQLTSPTITIAAWIKLNAVGANQIFLGQDGAAYYFRVTSSDKLDAEGTAGKLGGTSLTTGGWHHVAFVSDGSGNWVWYLDGVSDGSGSGFAWGGQDQTMRVGLAASTQPLDGKLAYVTIWNTALTSGNITTLQTSSTPESVGSGCIASWHLSSSALTDSSATANDLVVNGTVAFDADNPSLGGGGAAETFGFRHRRAQ